MIVAAASRRRARRTGVAALELAVLLPLLLFLFVITVDFARVFYFSLTLSNCARNGALWESDPYLKAESRYATVTDAALADAPNLMGDASNLPTVTSNYGTDSENRQYVEVTVSYNFKTVSGFPGISSNVALSRTVRMARAPLNPDR